MADNLLGEKGPNSDVETHLPLAPIADNRLTHWQKLFYRYDAWGNLVSRRNGIYEQHYRYDADNRLIQARGRGPQGELAAQYHYDALGRRSRKAAQTTRFLWQGSAGTAGRRQPPQLELRSGQPVEPIGGAGAGGRQPFGGDILVPHGSEQRAAGGNRRGG
ncbi:Uncharacterized conserved protein [Serratia entomophila]|nr:Uncharacterized conserved protein [Serratia entomophila]